MIVAPASRARRATSALVVSIEIGTVSSVANASTTGITRRSSSASETGSAPGPARFAAQVDEVGTLGHQPSRTVDGLQHNRTTARRRKSCPASS